MRTLLTMAWRNLWRNKRRTGILICAMVVGLAGVLVLMGLIEGWLDQMVDASVRSYEGHVKVTAEGYRQNPIVEHHMRSYASLLSELEDDSRVEGWAERVAVQGLLSTAEHSEMVRIIGIDPDQESRVSNVPGAVREGSFFDSPGGAWNPVLIGGRLAEKLGRSVGKKVVLMSQQDGNELGSGAFRIAGVFDTGHGVLDRHTVYILKADAQKLLNLGDRITEAVVMLQDVEDSEAVTQALARKLEDEPVEVTSWRQRLPIISDGIEISRRMMFLYYGIFYVAMAFGIVNTLLMAIGERTHEIGVMVAIGMNRGRLVLLVVLESFLVSLVSAAIGTCVGCAIVTWIGYTGIDLTALADVIEYFGIGRVLYPRLSLPSVAFAALATIGVGLAFSLYPALHASRLIPVEAIRRIR